MMLFNDTVSFARVCQYPFNGHAGMLSDETLNPGPHVETVHFNDIQSFFFAFEVLNNDNPELEV